MRSHRTRAATRLRRKTMPTADRRHTPPIVNATPDERIDAHVPVRLVLAAWTVPALLSTFETLMFYRLGGRPMEAWRAFLSESAGWYAWAACTPLVAWLAQRFP